MEQLRQLRKLIKRLIANAEKFKDYQKGIERTLKPDASLDVDRITSTPGVNKNYIKRLATPLNKNM